MFNDFLRFFTDGLQAGGVAIVNLFRGLISIFHNGTEFTLYGVILLIGVVVGLVFYGLNWLLSLTGLGLGGEEDDEE